MVGTSTLGTQGCLDSDGDMWSDTSDDCPTEAGNSTEGGLNACPDMDGDGWADSIDDLPMDPSVWSDSDDDGYGDSTESIEDCIQPDGYVENSDDCNDSSAEIYPGSARNEPLLCAKDSDGDGYGDMTPDIVAEAGTDCDDTDAQIDAPNK